MYLPITCQEPIAGTVVTAAGEGQTGNVVGDQITCKVASEQTDETYAVIEELSPSQGGTPLHLHRATDEVFYVVEDDYQVVAGLWKSPNAMMSSFLPPHG
jgi:hypothetical protein